MSLFSKIASHANVVKTTVTGAVLTTAATVASAATDYSALTTAADFASAITAVLGVGAAIMSVGVVIN